MILVFGTVCLDRILQVPNLPKPGGYVEITSEALFLGGEAANTANALRAWGADVALIGNPLGLGADADILRRLLSEHGLQNVNDPPSSHFSAPVCDIYVTPDSERTMFGRGFSKLEFGSPVAEIPFRKGAWFTAEPNLGSVAREVVRAAQAEGMKCYLMDFYREDDPIAPNGVWQSSTDWVGVRGEPDRNIEWVRAWVKRHRCATILTDGPRGLVAGIPDIEPRFYPAFPAPRLVDSTGAGDLFRAGVLFGLEGGWEWSRCLAFGAAAASLKCGTLGATSCVPSAEEVETHINTNPEVAIHYDLT